MRKKKHSINVDKLKLSFKQPKELWEYISDPDNDTTFDDFYLHIIDDGRGQDEEKEPNIIVANVLIEDTNADNTRSLFVLGFFTFNNSAKYDGLCFFTFSNQALYCPFTNKQNYIDCIFHIASVLNLEFNSVTELELALDINHNILPALRKMIKDYDNLDMFVNGKRVIDEERTIEDYGEYFTRSRKRLNRTPTIYIKQSKKDGLQLRIYDKTREIFDDNNTKKYIEEWNDFGKSNIYRLEVVIRWEQFKNWLNHVQTSEELPAEWKRYISQGTGEHTSPSEPDKEYLGRSIWLLGLKAYRYALWRFCADRLLYFRLKRGGEAVYLSDIAASSSSAA